MNERVNLAIGRGFQSFVHTPEFGMTDRRLVTKGRFFDRASDKLSQLARFATNELVSVDLQAVAAALSSHG